MESKKRAVSLFAGMVTLSLFINSWASAAAGGGQEERVLVSNGNGVSSPSFSDGLVGENPAGLAWNQKLKLQVTGAAYNSSLDPIQGGAGVLLGNGLFGAGLDFSKFTSGPTSSAGSFLNWGLAGHLRSMHLTLGVSGHHTIPGGSSSYDLGLMYEPSNKFRLGFMAPDFVNEFNVLAAGLTYELDTAAELVVDFDYSLNSKVGVVKPGVTFHAGPFHVTGAYGMNYLGNGESFLSKKFTAGLGFRVTQAVLFSYEYQGISLHRAGLTLRLN